MPFLALPLPFCQRLMPLVVLLLQAAPTIAQLPFEPHVGLDKPPKTYHFKKTGALQDVAFSLRVSDNVLGEVLDLYARIDTDGDGLLQKRDLPAGATALQARPDHRNALYDVHRNGCPIQCLLCSKSSLRDNPSCPSSRVVTPLVGLVVLQKILEECDRASR